MRGGNCSSNEYSVQYAMDELLKSIDYIMSYSEEELHQAEMSKAQLPEQKEFIKRNYNAMIEQARDRYKEKIGNMEDELLICNITTNI